MHLDEEHQHRSMVDLSTQCWHRFITIIIVTYHLSIMMSHALQMRPRAPTQLSSPAACRSRISANRLVVRAAKVADGPKIAIVGVTGAVGQEFLRVRACTRILYL